MLIQKNLMMRTSLILGAAFSLVACGEKKAPEPVYVPDKAEVPVEVENIELPEASADCVDTVIADGKFSTLAGLIQAALMADTLRAPGPFTIFAPNDEAFAALPEGTLNALLLPESRPTLQRILKHHVVEGTYTSVKVATEKSFTTVAGTVLPVSTTETSVTVGGAPVVATDLPCTNGVIHTLSAVSLPPDEAQ